MSSNKPLLVASATVAVVSLGAYFLLSRSDDADDADDVLPKEMILEIFSTLTKEMPAKMAPLMQQIQQLKAQNAQIDDKEIHKVIVQNFDNMLKAAQEKVRVDLLSF
jgi:hypothetical protein